VDGGAWPFLVGGVICLVDSDNERDSSLLTSASGEPGSVRRRGFGRCPLRGAVPLARSPCGVVSFRGAARDFLEGQAVLKPHEIER
jgi:hypothetical protein